MTTPPGNFSGKTPYRGSHKYSPHAPTVVAATPKSVAVAMPRTPSPARAVAAKPTYAMLIKVVGKELPVTAVGAASNTSAKMPSTNIAGTDCKTSRTRPQLRTPHTASPVAIPDTINFIMTYGSKPTVINAPSAEISSGPKKTVKAVATHKTRRNPPSAMPVSSRVGSAGVGSFKDDIIADKTIGDGSENDRRNGESTRGKARPASRAGGGKAGTTSGDQVSRPLEAVPPGRILIRDTSKIRRSRRHGEREPSASSLRPLESDRREPSFLSIAFEDLRQFYERHRYPARRRPKTRVQLFCRPGRVARTGPSRSPGRDDVPARRGSLAVGDQPPGQTVRRDSARGPSHDPRTAGHRRRFRSLVRPRRRGASVFDDPGQPAQGQRKNGRVPDHGSLGQESAQGSEKGRRREFNL